MSQPTTSVGFSKSTPTADDGFQLAKPQTDNGSPQQLIDFAVPNTGGAVVKTGDYTLTAADCGKLIVANSASAITFTLPATIPFGQWQVQIANIGAGALSVAPGGSLTLDSTTTAVSLAQLQGLSVATNGTNYFSGRGATPNAGVVGWDVPAGAGLAASPAGNIQAAVRSYPITKCIVTVTASDDTTDLTFDISQNGTSIFSAAQTVPAGTAAGTVLALSLKSASLPVAFKDTFSLNITAGTATWAFTVAVR